MSARRLSAARVRRIPIFGLHILSNAKLNALKAAGHDVATAATFGLTTAVHLAAQAGNPIGAATLAAIDATGKTGPEKRANVIAAVAPVIIAESGKGGFTAVSQDAETFAGLVIEEALSTVKQTPVVSIDIALLKLLGIVH